MAAIAAGRVAGGFTAGLVGKLSEAACGIGRGDKGGTVTAGCSALALACKEGEPVAARDSLGASVATVSKAKALGAAVIAAVAT